MFKVVTLAAALETTNLTPDSMINCGNGTINLFGRVIHDHDRYSIAQHGRCAGEIEQHRRHSNRPEGRREDRSTNISAQVRLRAKTGIELPGESARHAAAREAVEAELDRIGGHGARSQRRRRLQLALAGAVDRQWRHAGEAPAGAGAAEAGRQPMQRIAPEKPER